MSHTNDELIDFQKKVFAEYELIKSLKKTSDRMKDEREIKQKGCLFMPFTLLADALVKRVLKGETRKRNYDENRREARELLRQKEISDRICSMIAEISRREILIEKKFVDEITAALYGSDLASRFVIPENDVLYVMIATEIYETGLENFCNDQKGGE